MEFASAALAVSFAAFLGLWPFVFLLAVIRHAVGRRWQRVGQVAFLLPLWMVAASIGLVQLTPFLAALNAPPSRSPFVATAAIWFALCCAAVAWALLIRSFGSLPPPGGSQRPAA